MIRIESDPRKKGRKPRLTEEMLDRIAILCNQGLSTEEIAEEVGLSTASVCKAIRKRLAEQEALEEKEA